VAVLALIDVDLIKESLVFFRLALKSLPEIECYWMVLLVLRMWFLN